MAALLHFDTEFTHPVPSIGELMQIGCVVHEFNETTLECNTTRLHRIKINLNVSENAVCTSWVLENQSNLLNVCKAIPRDTSIVNHGKFVHWLKLLKEKYEKIIPAGYVLGSDFAYLLNLLGEQHELVHYAGIDFKALAIPLLRTFEISDEDIAPKLGVSPNENAHDALADAEFQMKLIVALLDRLKKQ